MLNGVFKPSVMFHMLVAVACIVLTGEMIDLNVT